MLPIRNVASSEVSSIYLISSSKKNRGDSWEGFSTLFFSKMPVFKSNSLHFPDSELKTTLINIHVKILKQHGKYFGHMLCKSSPCDHSHHSKALDCFIKCCHCLWLCCAVLHAPGLRVRSPLWQFVLPTGVGVLARNSLFRSSFLSKQEDTNWKSKSFI